MKLYLQVIFLFTIIIILIYAGCSQDSSVNSGTVTTKGVYVLCEGVNSLGSGDYSFIDLSNGNVSNNEFKNNNPGLLFPLYPNGFYMYGNKYLYITCQGISAGKGRMFKVDGETNKLLDSSSLFGSNPYDFTFALTNSTFYISNLSGSSVTQIDPNNLSIKADSIPVGPNPTELLFALYYIFVAKSSSTLENSLAIINTYSNSVAKIYLNFPPVSVANNLGGIYVSGYTKKKLYVLDSEFTHIVDSIQIHTTMSAIGDLVAGDARTLFVVGLAGGVGLEVRKYNIAKKTDTLIIPYQSGRSIYGIAYEHIQQFIYVTDAKSGSLISEVRAYDTDGNSKKTYEISGFYPKRFAFIYKQQ